MAEKASETRAIGNRVGYFRSCYAADNRDLVLLDFLGSSVDHALLLEGEDDLQSGFSRVVAIPEAAAQQIQKTLGLYAAERELLFGGFFALGQREGFRGANRLCAPLFLYPAELVEEDNYLLLSIDRSARRLNYSLLAEMLDDPSQLDLLAEAILEQAGEDELTRAAAVGIGSVLASFVPGIDTDQLVYFPEMWDAERVRRALQPKQLEKAGKLRIVPAAGIGMVRKSTDTLGILMELGLLADANAYSAPLRTLFGAAADTSPPAAELGRVPGILSAAQEGVLRTASRHPLSLVVGPPGTGKTYTVATVSVEHLTRGQSVLVAARTDEAVDVIAHKIQEQLQLPYVIVRGGRKGYLRELKEYVENLLNGMLPPGLRQRVSARELRSRLRHQDRRIASLEKEFSQRTKTEQDWGEHLVSDAENSSFLSGLRSRYIHWRSSHRRPLWEITSELHRLLDEHVRDTVSFIRATYAQQLRKVLARNRKDLQLFAKGLRARSTRKREEYFASADFRAILRAFPIWLVRLGDLAHNMPLREGLFDLAIIDEATQCDLASCLPALQRAKRALVTGDPRQLRHVSFLSRRRQAWLQEQHGLEDEDPESLDYRERSALDLVTDCLAEQEQAQFLDEHYRSTPEIIEFSNREFYAGALRIMTDRPVLPENEGVDLIRCGGTRDEDGANEVEAERVLADVRRLIEEQAELSPETCQSIGVLSPFRAQVELLTRMVESQCSTTEIERHRLAVGTPYAFQGEERDVMFLSLALDDASHPTAYRHLNRPDVFNVAITRARSRQAVLCSFSPDRLPTEALPRRYVEALAKHTRADHDVQHDQFCEAVRTALTARGLQVWPGYPVAGLQIDLIAKAGDHLGGIDLIGYPGQFADAFTLERYRMLRRAGLRTFPLPYTRWLNHRDQVLDTFVAFLQATDASC